MTVYYIAQLLILGLAWPLCIYRPSNKKKAAYLAAVFGWFWFLAAFRQGIGFDYQSYIDIFHQARASGNLMAAIRMPWEPGFNLLTYIIGLFTGNPVVLYGIYSALIFAPIAYILYRYCEDIWLSTWIYFTFSYFYTAMNFIRQSLACGIVLLSWRFLRDRKPVPFLLIIFIAACFHKTALVMIPLYFLAGLRLTPRWLGVYGVLTLSSYLASPWLVDIATNYVFQGYKGSFYIDTAYGFSPVFLLVPFSSLAICLALLPIWRKRCPHADLLANLMLFSAIIWLFITHHFILERFSHYSYLFAVLAVPSALSALRSSPQDRRQLAKLEQACAQLPKGEARKQALEAQRPLRQQVAAHEKYYWAAVAGFVLLTWLYNEFGQHINGFHNVFPYQGVLW